MWFQEIAGIPELAWNFDPTTLSAEAQAHMGTFETVSLRELQLPTRADAVRPLNVYGRSAYINTNRFDTSAMQAGATEKNMFQVASNFNCQEVGSVRTNPFSGKYLTGLMRDCTQGPSAAGGALMGAALRLATHRRSSIDLLELTALRATNGKCVAQPDTPYFDSLDVKVGLHTDTVALYDRSDASVTRVQAPPHIDQVFVSTCICRNGVTGAARQLLQCAYDGTYLCAARRKSKKLVLTLVGGCSFHNPIHMIIDAIVEAHTKYSGCLDPDCEVLLPIYNPAQEYLVATIKAKLNQ